MRLMHTIPSPIPCRAAGHCWGEVVSTGLSQPIAHHYPRKHNYLWEAVGNWSQLPPHHFTPKEMPQWVPGPCLPIASEDSPGSG